MYAKNKQQHQVADYNKSFVNKLDKLIINPRINCRKIGLEQINYSLLMSNSDIEFKVTFLNNGRLDKENTNPLIIKYLELSKKCYYKTDDRMNNLHGELLLKYQLKQSIKFNRIVKDTKDELSQFGYTEHEIVDVLIKFLYGIKPNKYKMLLWNCYGDIIYQNLSNHVKPKIKSIQCIDCGEWFNVPIYNKRSCRCENCKSEHNKVLKKIRNKRYYSNKVN